MSIRDRNGRNTGRVIDPDDIWVNKFMVLTGYAWWFEKYAPDETQLREAQEAAHAAKRGLWSEDGALWSLGHGGMESGSCEGRLEIHPSH